MSTNFEDKIAITGGTGFLGSHIIRALVERGYKNIVALKRQESDVSLVADLEDQIQWVIGDILDILSLEDLCSNAAYVIHSAAKVSYNPRDRKTVYKVNVEGTANVVNVCLGIKSFKKLLFISSVAALGRSPQIGQINEETPWHDDQVSSNYGIAKHLAELEVWRGMTEGLAVGVLNPSMIIGPSHWGDSSTKLITYVADGRRFFPEGSNGFVDVRDLADLTVRFLESDIVNERVIAVSEMSTYKNLLESIAHNMKVKKPSKPLSPFLANILWRLISFRSDPSITKETVAITSSNFSYDNSKSVELFDFKYRPLSISIAETVLKFMESKQKKKSYAFFEQIYD